LLLKLFGENEKRCFSLSILGQLNACVILAYSSVRLLQILEGNLLFEMTEFSQGNGVIKLKIYPIF
jgi:hypothetical protein